MGKFIDCEELLQSRKRLLDEGERRVLAGLKTRIDSSLDFRMLRQELGDAT